MRDDKSNASPLDGAAGTVSQAAQTAGQIQKTVNQARQGAGAAQKAAHTSQAVTTLLTLKYTPTTETRLPALSSR